VLLVGGRLRSSKCRCLSEGCVSVEHEHERITQRKIVLDRNNVIIEADVFDVVNAMQFVTQARVNTKYETIIRIQSPVERRDALSYL
jgi:hypothetical protein